MTTLRTTSPAEAAAFIRRGQTCAFPTETVYGLGADAFCEAAVRAIFEAKGRPPDNPLIVHVTRPDQVPHVAQRIPGAARQLMERFFPGPLTLVLPRHPDLPPVVTAGLDTVGVRMPRHPVAQAFLAACGTPVAAPSANRSGRPSPTSWQAVLADLDGRIPCLLRGGRTEAGLESTVVDATGAAPVVLRAGVVTLEQLRAVCPKARLADEEYLADEKHEAPPRSPGTRYRHYAPRACVRLVDRPGDARPDAPAAYIGLTPPEHPRAFRRVQVCADEAEYARELFHFFRESDAAGCAVIYAERVPPHGLGRALMDRLQRAAAA